MEKLTRVSINIFPIVMLFMILLNNHGKMERTKSSHYFDGLTLFTMLDMIVEVAENPIVWMCGETPDLRLWVIHVARLMVCAGIASAWLCYVTYRLYENRVCRYTRYISWGAHTVFAADAVAILLVPWEKFGVNAGESALMPTYYYVVRIESIFLIALSIGIAAYLFFHSDTREKRIECIFFMVFGLIPIFGILMQGCAKEWKLEGASISIAILYIYVNTQNRQITMDSLTGLYNRRELDAHLQRMMEQHHTFGLLMMDMDDFKMINDNLGHAIGDDAIWQTADILRRRLGRQGTFLARYGGDEFVAVGEWQSKEQVSAVMEELQDEVAVFNATGNKEYRLSLSVGYALSEEKPADIAEMIALADGRMYEVKQQKKR